MDQCYFLLLSKISLLSILNNNILNKIKSVDNNLNKIEMICLIKSVDWSILYTIIQTIHEFAYKKVLLLGKRVLPFLEKKNILLGK